MYTGESYNKICLKTTSFKDFDLVPFRKVLSCGLVLVHTYLAAFKKTKSERTFYTLKCNSCRHVGIFMKENF